MKIKDGFVIRCIADEYMAIPAGDRIQNFRGVIILNHVSAFILAHMKNQVTREELVSLLTAEYDVAPELAANDLDAILEKLDSLGMIDR